MGATVERQQPGPAWCGRPHHRPLREPSDSADEKALPAPLPRGKAEGVESARVLTGMGDSGYRGVRGWGSRRGRRRRAVLSRLSLWLLAHDHLLAHACRRVRLLGRGWHRLRSLSCHARGQTRADSGPSVRVDLTPVADSSGPTSANASPLSRRRATVAGQHDERHARKPQLTTTPRSLERRQFASTERERSANGHLQREAPCCTISGAGMEFPRNRLVG